MLGRTESVISDATQHIMKIAIAEIKVVEQANMHKSSFSNSSMLKIVTEISDQNASFPQNSIELDTPKQSNSARIDNLMSVINVKKQQQLVNKKPSIWKHRPAKTVGIDKVYQVLLNKKKYTLNKLQLLHEQDDNNIQNKEVQKQKDLQIIHDRFRLQLQKKQYSAENSQQEKSKRKGDYSNLLGKKQKYSYDYSYQQIPVKKTRNVKNLVTNNEILSASLSNNEISKNSQNPESTKVIATKVIQLQLSDNIVQNTRKKSVQPTIEQQPRIISFSDVNNLSDQLQCSSGTKFIFEGTVLKKQPKSSRSQNYQQKYSQQQYLLLKNKQQTITNPHTNKLQNQQNKSSLQNNASIKLSSQKKLSDKTRNKKIITITKNKRKVQEQQKSSITVVNYSVMENFKCDTLSTPTVHKYKHGATTSLTYGQDTNPEPATQDTEKTSYLVQLLKKRQKLPYLNLQLPNLKLSKLALPKMSLPKNGYLLKSRAKVENRYEIINEMKKKFQETLRANAESTRC